MEKTDVLIADDHPMVREGLRSLLETEKGFNVVAEAGDGEEALKYMERHKPMMAILDISMPKLNGIDTARQLLKRWPKTRVVMLTMHHDEAFLVKVMEIGVQGYLLKDAAGDEILRALKRIAEGEKYFSQSAMEAIGRHISKKNDPNVLADKEAAERLTKRELQILSFIAEGMSTPEIAKKLYLSPRTVDTHRANIMHKLNIHQATGLVRFALENGLFASDKTK